MKRRLRRRGDLAGGPSKGRPIGTLVAGRPGAQSVCTRPTNATFPKVTTSLAQNGRFG